MNFARAWLSRLIRLAKTGLQVTPTPSDRDRLQTAREERRLIRADRARAAKLGHERRVHRQYLNDPLMKAAREAVR